MSEQNKTARNFAFTDLNPLAWLRAFGQRRGRRLPGNEWLAVAGLLFLFSAALIEHPTVTNWLGGGKHEGFASAVFSLKTGISFLKEIGFALLIAWGVSTGIERQARERDERQAEETRGRIAQDVVHAVYGLQHDPAYVRTVIEHALQPKIVREFYDVSYTIDPLSQAEVAALGVAPDRFVKFSSISKYRFRNVSNAVVDFNVRYVMAVRHAAKLREFAKVDHVAIEGHVLSAAEIEAGLESADDAPYKGWRWDRAIPGRADLEIMIAATMLKELSDNEVWRNFHPTVKGMELKVQVKVPGLRFGVRSITASSERELYNLPSGDAAWKIDGPILPNESVVLWWRTAEDDGELTLNEPPKASIPELVSLSAS